MAFEEIKQFVGDKIHEFKFSAKMSSAEKRLYKIFKKQAKVKPLNEVGYKIPPELLAIDFYGAHLPEAIYLNLVERYNGEGYLEGHIGEVLQALMYDENGERNENDIYVKTSLQAVNNSVFETGIRCYGNLNSMAGILSVPKTSKDVDILDTIEAMPSFVGLVGKVKSKANFSQGGNFVDTTLILSIPRGTPKEDIIYYSKESDTYNIKPEFVYCSIPISKEGIVRDIYYRADRIIYNELMEEERKRLERFR